MWSRLRFARPFPMYVTITGKITGTRNYMHYQTVISVLGVGYFTSVSIYTIFFKYMKLNKVLGFECAVFMHISTGHRRVA